MLVAIRMAASTDGCLVRNDWICGEYLLTRRSEILAALGQHLQITVISLVIAIVISIPLALLARRFRLLRGFVLGASTVVYTIPSLAMFSLLLPFTGLSPATVIVGLVLYSLTVLVRAMVAGLDGAPYDVVDAARGMGYGTGRLLWQVEVPLALPSIMAGVRVAAVSAVALSTVGSIVGYGGLGNLLLSGLQTIFRAEVLTASVLCVVLAVVLDLLLLAVQRVAMPWRRALAETR